MRLRDITGQTFGRLTVVRRAPNRGHHTMWECQCECGGTTVVSASDMKRDGAKAVRSCGCAQYVRTHGLSHSPEYVAWVNMCARCHNPKNPRFKQYGGRGISVCAEWRESFESFIAALGRRPSPSHSLDKINNDGNYEPGNVRWATRQEQIYNCQRTHHVVVDGQVRAVGLLAKQVGMHPDTVIWRLTQGWSLDEALSTPPLTRRKKDKQVC